MKLVDAAIVLLGVSLKDSDELVETDADTDGEAGVESDGVLDALPAVLGETEADAGRDAEPVGVIARDQLGELLGERLTDGDVDAGPKQKLDGSALLFVVAPMMVP